MMNPCILYQKESKLIIKAFSFFSFPNKIKDIRILLKFIMNLFVESSQGSPIIMH